MIPQRWPGVEREMFPPVTLSYMSPRYHLPPPATALGYGDTVHKQGWSPLSHGWHCVTCVHVAAREWTPTSIPASPAGSCGVEVSPASTPQHLSLCPGMFLGPSSCPCSPAGPALTSAFYGSVRMSRAGWSPSPWPRCGQPKERLLQHRTLPALRLPDRLPPAAPILHSAPFTARAACDPWVKPVQGQAQPALSAWVSQKPRQAFPCYREVGSEQNPIFQESIKTLLLPKAPAEPGLQLFSHFAPRNKLRWCLLSLCSAHVTP